ncbi:DNA-binding HxlR family transcriptional regulator [Catenulispora sp. EB89]
MPRPVADVTQVSSGIAPGCRGVVPVVTHANSWALPATDTDEHGPCDDDCGIRDVQDRLGDRWSVLVIVELAKGVRRFGALKSVIPGISQRMLTVTTKRLIRDGLVERTVYPTIPPQTDYRLTPMGESFAQAVAALADWSRQHKEAVAVARLRFDLDHPGEL